MDVFQPIGIMLLQTDEAYSYSGITRVYYSNKELSVVEKK
jgi:hypothetical protein